MDQCWLTGLTKQKEIKHFLPSLRWKPILRSDQYYSTSELVHIDKIVFLFLYAWAHLWGQMGNWTTSFITELSFGSCLLRYDVKVLQSVCEGGEVNANIQLIITLIIYNKNSSTAMFCTRKFVFTLMEVSRLWSTLKTCYILLQWGEGNCMFLKASNSSLQCTFIVPCILFSKLCHLKWKLFLALF